MSKATHTTLEWAITACLAHRSSMRLNVKENLKKRNEGFFKLINVIFKENKEFYKRAKDYYSTTAVPSGGIKLACKNGDER